MKKSPFIGSKASVSVASLVAAFAFAITSAHAGDAESSKSNPRKSVMTTEKIEPGKNDIHFVNKTMAGDLKLAAHLYTPDDFDAAKAYPTVVYAGPFNQVKEQTGAVYAQQLARRGYVTIVFDYPGYGDSEGEIRNNENSFVKIESIRNAISFMGTLPFVDRDRMFGLGVCASGGYMALVATTDKRLKAIASVSGMLGNKTAFFGKVDRETATALFTKANAARQHTYETGEVQYIDAMGFDGAQNAPEGTAVREGYDYYMTARAGAETYPNFSHLSPGFMIENPHLADAMSFADVLYTPFIGIYGEHSMNDNSGPLTVAFYEKASDPKELVQIKGATHVSLYDNDAHVTRAVDAMTAFFEKHSTN